MNPNHVHWKAHFHAHSSLTDYYLVFNNPATYEILWIYHNIWKYVVSQDLHPNPSFHKDVMN